MALMDIKASQLRARESAELLVAIQQELATARKKVGEQEQSIADLLGENTKLKSQLAQENDELRAEEEESDSETED